MAGSTPANSMAAVPNYTLFRRLFTIIPRHNVVRTPHFISQPFGATGLTASRSLAATTTAAAAAETESASPESDKAPVIHAFAKRTQPMEPPPLLPANEDERLESLAPPSSTNASNTAPEGPQTGAFQRLPMVSPSREIIESALRRAKWVGGNKGLKNEAARAKNKAARQMDALMKELTGPLGSYERGFPPVHRLHPFERALLELTVGPGTYEKALARVAALRKASVEVAKGYAARASKAANKKDAIALQEEGFTRVEAVFGRGAASIDELKEVAKSLRRLPVVDPRLPTVALVGAPNVGKSSLVQLLSSGLPEVQNYPFTTRSIKMGHFYIDGRRHQVTDTPGLLSRPDEDRNAMERLTLASLQHLPTAVLFVTDLTAECGTSVEDQWRIRGDLKSRFENKPWIDVFSKADLLEEELDEASDLISAGKGGNGESIGAVGATIAQDAVAFAAAVPGALRVSSLTGAGVDELKADMLRMLEEHELKSEGLEAWEGEHFEDGDDNEGGVVVPAAPIELS